MHQQQQTQQGKKTTLDTECTLYALYWSGMYRRGRRRAAPLDAPAVEQGKMPLICYLGAADPGVV
jgi:hypothetical protein